MTNEQGYNGWANYPTWTVALWIGNEEGSATYWQEQAQGCIDTVKSGNCEQVSHGWWEPKRAPVFLLEGMLKSEFEESNPLADDSSMWADLMSWTLGEVNWREVAEGLLEEMLDQIEETKSEEV